MKLTQHTAIRIICLGWLVCKLISFRAWTYDRLFPVVPALNFLDDVPSTVHLLLFCTSIICFSALALFPKRKYIAVVLLISEVFSCSLDVIRWQPWEYQFLFFLAAFIAFRNNQNRFYACVLFILASTYIFGGLHKLNVGFLHNVWSKIILQRYFNLVGHDAVSSLLHYSGLIIPISEIICGICIIALRKAWPFFVLTLFHLSVLIIFGPAGLNSNVVIWPWNVALILLVLIMAKQNTKIIFHRTLPILPVVVLLLFWGIFPLLGLFGLWDNYLSSGLYSGRTTTLRVYTSSCDNFLPEDYKATRNNLSGTEVRFQNWALAELKVPVYPEVWYYSRLKNKWFSRYGNANDIFVIARYPGQLEVLP